MVRLFFLSIVLFFNNLVFSQIINDSILELGYVVESIPKYEGGETRLKLFIKDSILYPTGAKKDKIEGTVFIQFIVDTNGIALDHIILKGIRKDLDEEALRVAKLIEFEKPAMQRGKPIKVKFTIPIEFKLPNEKEYKKKGCEK